MFYEIKFITIGTFTVRVLLSLHNSVTENSMQTIFIVNILTEWTPGKISEKCRNCFFDRLENVLLTIKAETIGE
jgi:hypothetical protein